MIATSTIFLHIYKYKYYFYPHKNQMQMKTSLLVILLLLITTPSFSQTATNFTVKDCVGNTHDLFSELDSGKVVVLNWVMPCGACIPASLTTFNVVQNYQETNPDAVRYYLVDDLANTNCTSLMSWAKNNHITPVASFSDSLINMLDYGTQAMPKIVVLGGGNHHVFMVADAVFEIPDLQEAINAALIIAGFSEKADEHSWINVFPNPATDKIMLTIKAERAIPTKAELFSTKGLKIATLYNGTLLQGENRVNIDLSEYLPGIYFIRVSDIERSATIKLAVKR
jgi:hypothetical protein